MPTSFADFFEKMDELQWFRMVVCFLPGLVFVKLAGMYPEIALLGWISTTALLVGVAVYLLWALIRRLVIPESIEDSDQTDLGEHSPGQAALSVQKQESSQEQLQLLNDLRVFCLESERESDRLIAAEVAVNPDLTYLEATRSALNRRKIFGRQ